MKFLSAVLRRRVTPRQAPRRHRRLLLEGLERRDLMAVFNFVSEVGQWNASYSNSPYNPSSDSSSGTSGSSDFPTFPKVTIETQTDPPSVSGDVSAISFKWTTTAPSTHYTIENGSYSQTAVFSIGEHARQPVPTSVTAVGVTAQLRSNLGSTATITGPSGSDTSEPNGFIEYHAIAASVGSSLTLHVEGSASASNGREIFSFGEVQLSPLLILGVEATNAPKLANGHLGKFLSGVKLQQEFVVSAFSPSETRPLSMRYVLDTGETSAISYNNGWKFTTDVGLLGVGERQLRVQLLIGNEVIDEISTTLEVVDQVPFTFKVDDRLGTSSNYVPIAQIRLLESVPYQFTPQLVVANTFTLLPVYRSKLAVQAVSRASGTALLEVDLAFQTGRTFTGVFRGQDFPNAVASANLPDYDLFLVPRAAHRTSLVKYNALAPHKLLVTPLPNWMGTPVSKVFRPLTTADPVFNSSGGAYAITFNVSPVQKDFGTTSNTPYELFDGLETKVGLGATLVAYARFVSAPAAEVQAKEIYAKAMILGASVLDRTVNLQTGSIRAAATLDGKSLTGSTITITSTLIDLLPRVVNKVLIDRPVTLKDIPTPIPSVKAGLAGALRVELTTLKAQAGLGIDISGNTPKLVEATTFLRLVAKVNLQASLAGFATVNIVGVNLATFAAGAGIVVDLGADLKVNFADSFSMPRIAFNAAESKAFLAITLNTAWDVSLLNQDPNILEELQGEPITNANAKERKIIPLFGLAAPTDFSDFSSGEKVGTVSTNNGNAVMGNDSPPPAQQRTNSSNQAPGEITATITLPGIADDTLRGFSYEVNVHADASSLTAGQHTLETVLIDAGTDAEQIIDTWDLGLLSPTSVDPLLGFSTGFLLRSVVIPEAALELGRSYRLMVRFQSDRSGSGETMAAELRNGAIETAPPEIEVKSLHGSLDDGQLDFGVDSNGSVRAFVLVSNNSPIPLQVLSVAASPGFSVGYALRLPVTLNAGGGVLAIPVDVLDPAAVATGTLTIVSNDPSSPHVINLNSSGGLAPLDPVARIGNDLVISGTDSVDVVAIEAGSLAGAVLVTLNGVQYGPFSAMDKIVARLNGGNDQFTSEATLTIPMDVYGGAGNDNLQTAAGNDWLYGGAGTDTLAGGAGTNRIIQSSTRPTLSNLGGNLRYTENGVPLAVVANTAAVADTDSPYFAGGKLTVKFSAGGKPEDRLAIRTSATITTNAAKEVRFSGTLIGTFTGGTGTAPLVISLNAQATPARTAALLKNVVYSNVSEMPLTTPRTIWMQLDDGDGGVSLAATKQLTVVAVNDKPVLGGISGTVGYTNASASIGIATTGAVDTATATVSDVDSTNFATGKLTVRVSAGGHSSNRIELSGTVFTLDAVANADGTKNLRRSGVIIGTLNANGGVGLVKFEVTFNTAATAPIVQQLTRVLRFRTINSASAADRVISLTLTDGDGGTSVAVTKTVDVG